MFERKAIDDAKEHARTVFPAESCGIIRSGEYVPCDNVHEDPESNFKIDPKVYLGYLNNGEVEAIIHSHPSGRDCPTKLDMEGQIQTAVPWGIIPAPKGEPVEPFFFGDQLPVADMVGREFRAGVHDCYALVRDWYRLEKGVVLPVFPRDELWWQQNQNLISDNFAAAGFHPVDLSEIEPGDVATGRIMGPVDNHCAVYLRDGLILHHLSRRLSCREPIERWRRFISKVYRFGGKS